MEIALAHLPLKRRNLQFVSQKAEGIRGAALPYRGFVKIKSIALLLCAQPPKYIQKMVGEWSQLSVTEHKDDTTRLSSQSELNVKVLPTLSTCHIAPLHANPPTVHCPTWKRVQYNVNRRCCQTRDHTFDRGRPVTARPHQRRGLTVDLTWHRPAPTRVAACGSWPRCRWIFLSAITH